MSDYTPSMDVVRRAASDYHAPITPEEFDRALAAHDAEVRASVLAEQGEPPAATVRAALRAYYKNAWGGGWTEQHEEQMRAALRAAAETTKSEETR